ncbi:MAG: hypothetical protein NC178_06520 [Bacteroides sp.]|nr:hypothetical protein [Bacteroides sp.]
MMQRKPVYLIIAALTAAMAAGGCGGSDDTASEADSLRSDSLRRVEEMARMAARCDSLRADSLRSDSLRRDSLFAASALTYSDFFLAGSPIRFVGESHLIANLEAKGYEVVGRQTHNVASNNGEGTTSATDYRLLWGGDSASTSITIRYSETYHPIAIDYTNDRHPAMLIESLRNNGFADDATGNLAHQSNTDYSGATVTRSGRRIVIERVFSF